MAQYQFNGVLANEKELARLAPANTNEATLYTNATTRGAADCWLVIVNLTGTAANATVGFLKGGGATGNEDYEYNVYSVPARGRRTIPMPGFENGDLVKVTAGTANALRFSLRGVELA